MYWCEKKLKLIVFIAGSVSLSLCLVYYRPKDKAIAEVKILKSNDFSFTFQDKRLASWD